MTLTMDQILLAVTELDIAEREALLSELHRKFGRPDQEAFDAACAAESKRRLALYEADPSCGRDAFEALDALQKRLKR